ncbi:MAG TPA: hypothetical protein IGS31_09290 [Oscillatoriales cyanobacterium M4454_W2019_049]|nr:hypothetical protein [Oscillatoriales cyanobacterium M4454_W2019_049]
MNDKSEIAMLRPVGAWRDDGYAGIFRGGDIWGRSIVGCRGSRIAATNIWIGDQCNIAMLRPIDLLRGRSMFGIFRGDWAKHSDCDIRGILDIVARMLRPYGGWGMWRDRSMFGAYQ